MKPRRDNEMYLRLLDLDPEAVVYFLNREERCGGVVPGLKDVFAMIEYGDWKSVADFLAPYWSSTRHWLVADGDRIKPVVAAAESPLPDAQFWCRFALKLIEEGWGRRFGRCLYCGRWFFKSRSDQKFCCDSCRGSYNKRVSLQRRRLRREIEVEEVSSCV